MVHAPAWFEACRTPTCSIHLRVPSVPCVHETSCNRVGRRFRACESPSHRPSALSCTSSLGLSSLFRRSFAPPAPRTLGRRCRGRVPSSWTHACRTWLRGTRKTCRKAAANDEEWTRDATKQTTTNPGNLTWQLIEVNVLTNSPRRASLRRNVGPRPIRRGLAGDRPGNGSDRLEKGSVLKGDRFPVKNRMLQL